MSPRETDPKITPQHLSRLAVVYLRQSSLAQVKQNTESQRLQYALTQTAHAYGFQRSPVPTSRAKARGVCSRRSNTASLPASRKASSVAS